MNKRLIENEKVIKNYQVKREYKSIITSEEMIKRMIRNHMNEEGQNKQGIVRNKMQNHQDAEDSR